MEGAHLERGSSFIDFNDFFEKSRRYCCVFSTFRQNSRLLMVDILHLSIYLDILVFRFVCFRLSSGAVIIVSAFDRGSALGSPQFLSKLSPSYPLVYSQ